MRFEQIFFVDSENIGIPDLTKYVSKKHSQIVILHNEDFHLQSDTYKFIKVDTGNRKNALDFVLSTLLGSYCATYGTQVDYIIVSNDNGYKSIIDFWNNEGYEVRQLKILNPSSEEFKKISCTALDMNVVNKCINVIKSHPNSKITDKKMKKELLHIKGVTPRNIEEIIKELGDISL